MIIIRQYPKLRVRPRAPLEANLAKRPPSWRRRRWLRSSSVSRRWLCTPRDCRPRRPPRSPFRQLRNRRRPAGRPSRTWAWSMALDMCDRQNWSRIVTLGRYKCQMYFWAFGLHLLNCSSCLSSKPCLVLKSQRVTPRSSLDWTTYFKEILSDLSH